MNKQTKLILAIVLLVAAAVVIAWQANLFGGSNVVQPTGIEPGKAKSGPRTAPGAKLEDTPPPPPPQK